MVMQQLLRTRSRIIPIGNSQGVRIPKALLEQSGLHDDVELAVDAGRIIVQPLTKPREGWEAAFRVMAEQGEDRLLDDDLTGSSAWDKNEWEW